jgi:hypothetical protein
LAHAVMEAEKFHEKLSLCDAGSMVQSKSKSLRTREANGVPLSLRPDNKGHWYKSWSPRSEA